MNKKECFKIQGGRVLSGEVETFGSKNAILPLLFSSLLSEGRHEFQNVPNLKDIDVAISILESIGSKIDKSEGKLVVHTQFPLKYNPEEKYLKKMRASILCLGPLLSICKKAKIYFPGGCLIGKRPIDFHIHALESLGATFDIKENQIDAHVKEQFLGTSITFKKPTVGGTENILLASVLSEGTTHIFHAALEPEVLDLISYLKKMGAQIEIKNASSLEIKGVKKLNPPAYHIVIPDRIEAGTLLLSAAITKGSVCIKNCNPNHLEILIQKLREVGFKIESTIDSIFLDSPHKIQATNIETGVYPLFPTDLQSQFVTLMTQAQGESQIVENIFENRFNHIKELEKMKAFIKIKEKTIIVKGPSDLQGAHVISNDLRASASLVLAGLVAKGETIVFDIHHLDRGYDSLHEKLKRLGAKIERTIL